MVKYSLWDALINEELVKRFKRDFDNYQVALGLEKHDSSDECSSLDSKKPLIEKVYSAEIGERSRSPFLNNQDEDDKRFKMMCINCEKELEGRNFSFDEWRKRRFGTTNEDKHTKIIHSVCK